MMHVGTAGGIGGDGGITDRRGVRLVDLEQRGLNALPWASVHVACRSVRSAGGAGRAL